MRNLPEPKTIVSMALLTEGVLIGLAWGGGMLFEIYPWRFVALTPLALVWGVLAALPLLAGMVWTTHSQWDIFVRLRQLVRERVIPIFADCSIFDMLLIAIFAGVGEELFFRGLLQTGLVRVSSVWFGLGVASVIFGLLHSISRTYAVLAALIGVYLGVWFVATDNLAVPMIAHAVYDFVALVYLVGRFAGQRQFS